MGHCQSALPVTMLLQYRSLALNHIIQLTENFNIVLLVNSLTRWCVLMVNNAFMISENCQYHFHLAPNFGLGDSGVFHCSGSEISCWYLLLLWSLHLDQHTVTNLWLCKASLFLMNCQQYWNKFCWMIKSSVRMGWFEPNESLTQWRAL